MAFGIKTRRRAHQPAPPPDDLPWSQTQTSLEQLDPPRPLILRMELSEEDVALVKGGGAGKGSAVPAALVMLLYFGLNAIFDDGLPNWVLYALLGLSFVLNTLLSATKAKDHYAQTGSMAVTVSLDGVEISAESWSGHVPWVMVDKVQRTEGLCVLRTAGKPAFHAFPLRTLSPAEVQELDVWLQIAEARRTRPKGRGLLWVALGLAVAGAAYWLWQHFGADLLPIRP